MRFWQCVGNCFKNFFKFIWKCIKWLFAIVAAFFCWLIKTTVGKVITGTIAGIVVIVLLTLFIKYCLLGLVWG